MAYKQFEVEDVGTVTIYKRRGVRSMKLSIASNGSIRVSLPLWAPYKLGIEFVRAKSHWIQSKQIPKTFLSDNQHIGKAHRLFFIRDDVSKPATRVSATEIRITIPLDADIEDKDVQAAAEAACIRALKKQAEQLLPMRLKALADRHEFVYRSVRVKQLKGRWGSCNEQKDITFNCFLMQLPWELIDYVILHELTHTRIMAHGKPFWDEMALYVPNLPGIRKKIRAQQPILTAT
ncbi:MAG: hypothetical protein JWL85_380 [Candidatus Saccharibacteria bacterium]|nr:hypothetical protein [Candidatus Saccharibacteria bacterium]